MMLSTLKKSDTKKSTETTACCDNCCQTSEPSANESSFVKKQLPLIISLALFFVGLGLDYYGTTWFEGPIKLFWFVAAYVLVGGEVVLKAVRSIGKKQLFNEFFLMSLATICAFFIGEYAEAVAVMLFYVIGENVQHLAVNKSRKSIKGLIDVRPEEVRVLRDNNFITADPKTVQIGEVVQLKPGEKVALDGRLKNEQAVFDSSALTGESKPATKRKGEKVLAGMINLNRVSKIEVTAVYENSTFSKILQLTEEATSRKAEPERFITRFSKVYTPIVVVLAVALTFLPYLFVDNYIFEDWLYRALVFLVISCPCALVISIPLGYFGGIGAASKNGILFKGANFLDWMTKTDTVVFDKTGTLTEGVFEVQKVEWSEDCNLTKQKFIEAVAVLESHSNHPVAKAVTKFANLEGNDFVATNVEEISGYGMRGEVAGRQILSGKPGWLHKNKIKYPSKLDKISDSVITVAIDGVYSGCFVVADRLKKDTENLVKSLNDVGIKNTAMLSGDRDSVVQLTAEQLKIKKAYGELLPQDKLNKVEMLQKSAKNLIFVGDGINDAPVIRLADIGVAMGGLGSDAAIETADVVIQNDQPSKLVTAFKVARKTKTVVWQNIGLAFGIKFAILLLAVLGMTSLWAAVFADVGVALLAILNAVRIQRIKFE